MDCETRIVLLWGKNTGDSRMQLMQVASVVILFHYLLFILVATSTIIQPPQPEYGMRNSSSRYGYRSTGYSEYNTTARSKKQMLSSEPGPYDSGSSSSEEDPDSMGRYRAPIKLIEKFAMEKLPPAYYTGQYDHTEQPSLPPQAVCYCPCTGPIYRQDSVHNEVEQQIVPPEQMLYTNPTNYEPMSTSIMSESDPNIICDFANTDCGFVNDAYWDSLFRYGYSERFHAHMWIIDSSQKQLDVQQGVNRGWGRVVSSNYPIPANTKSACVMIEFVFESEGTDKLIVSVQDAVSTRTVLDYMHEQPNNVDNVLLRKFVHFAIEGESARFFIQFEFNSSLLTNHYGLRAFHLFFGSCPRDPKSDSLSPPLPNYH